MRIASPQDGPGHLARRRRSDAALVGTSAAGVIATWLLMIAGPPPSGQPPHAASVAVGLALAAALVWRRRAPTLLIVAATVTSPVWVALVPQLFALFVFARTRPRASCVAGSAIALGSVAPSILGDASIDATLVHLIVAVVLVGTVLAAAATTLRHRGRSVVDWLRDISVYLLAWLINLAVLSVGLDDGAITLAPALARDIFAVSALTVALWFRRDWPEPIAVAGIVVAPFAQFGIGTFLVATFSVAARRPIWKTLAVAGGYVAATTAHVVLGPGTGIPVPVAALLAALAYGGIAGWGTVARSRDALVRSLRERARQAETEQELRLERARRLERERIAREMHDVLAHQLSLLSVHAGALEYRRDASPDEVGTSATVIRNNAHRALEDLREIIGILRADPETTDPDPPQPTLQGLGMLIDEASDVGVAITSDIAVNLDSVPERTARTAYRVVQEALTNARKHAPGAPVSVRITGPDCGLVVEVNNPTTASVGARSSPIPGAHTGLVGLRERVDLAGGEFSSGMDPDGRFVVHARLPWPS